MRRSLTVEFPASNNLEKNIDDDDVIKKLSWYNSPATTSIFHYFTLFILGILTWGLLWLTWGDNWRWDGSWFRIAAVGAVAWASGRVLHATTTLPPLLGALLTGIFARNLGILDMRDFTVIDVSLRRIYPVLILGKGSLGWDVNYMRRHWRRVAGLGAMPWTAEVLTVTVLTRFLLGFPWIWGLLLGSIYASASCPVIMPSVVRASAGASAHRNWPQLVCTAGGADTALSVGVFGLVSSFMFSDTDDDMRYVRAALTMFLGVMLGVAWGYLAGLLPHSKDRYLTEIRILFVLLSGLFGHVFTMHYGWGGTGAVAVLSCNATAATFWARTGWRLNNNPASTAYRVLWAAAEPLVFAYSGTFFVMSPATGRTLLYGLAILAACLTVRLTVAALVCWDMSLKEKIFVCCAWTPKSFVEAVLGPVAINTFLLSSSYSKQEMGYADDLLRLIIQAILITTPIGFLLTHYLGPWLLKEKKNNIDFETHRRKSSTKSQIEDVRL
ncbi:sodium/hydrogen exchanger 9B2-like isoform X2 [Pectinophora gossypiella]|uniref:sodium/hydrogen exchanger 9B2-like isoform X2 n=1 Tax=Pectinophora gossypiella TaxID=13191 RepID=UPI00214E6295|nr:sodium/hydrogen exchanger 9B2-like isoform X2 [Pectinophora gossypiella]